MPERFDFSASHRSSERVRGKMCCASGAAPAPATPAASSALHLPAAPGVRRQKRRSPSRLAPLHERRARLPGRRCAARPRRPPRPGCARARPAARPAARRRRPPPPRAAPPTPAWMAWRAPARPMPGTFDTTTPPPTLSCTASAACIPPVTDRAEAEPSCRCALGLGAWRLYQFSRMRPGRSTPSQGTAHARGAGGARGAHGRRRARGRGALRARLRLERQAHRPWQRLVARPARGGHLRHARQPGRAALGIRRHAAEAADVSIGLVRPSPFLLLFPPCRPLLRRRLRGHAQCGLLAAPGRARAARAGALRCSPALLLRCRTQLRGGPCRGPLRRRERCAGPSGGRSAPFAVCASSPGLLQLTALLCRWRSLRRRRRWHAAFCRRGRRSRRRRQLSLFALGAGCRCLHLRAARPLGGRLRQLGAGRGGGGGSGCSGGFST